MSKERLPNTLYHSISQARLKEAVDQDQLPGHSTLHHDPTGKMRGIWLSDELTPIVDAHHGLEQSDEIIGTLPLPSGEVIEVKKPVFPIILEVKGLDKENLLPHIIDPHQFFYVGNIEWDRVKKFLVPHKEPEVSNVAEELAQRLKVERDVTVEVETFDPMDIGNELIESIKENKNPLKFIDRENTRY
jgi:hypothetical protein